MGKEALKTKEELEAVARKHELAKAKRVSEEALMVEDDRREALHSSAVTRVGPQHWIMIPTMWI